MADYESRRCCHHQQAKETALQVLNTIIQLHFEKTLENKRAIDQQKKELNRLFLLFFIFLVLLFNAVSQPFSRLQCRHCRALISLLSFSHLVFYISVAQTLCTINSFLVPAPLPQAHPWPRHREVEGVQDEDERGDGEQRRSPHPHHHEVLFDDRDFEILYQEPPESYLGKFKRN